jgi:hypothetical protein
MQEDQRTVRSTLNAISGGLSFRTGSIHPDALPATTNIGVDALLLRWKSIAPVCCLPEESLIHKLLENADTFVAADLKQARGLVNRW